MFVSRTSKVTVDIHVYIHTVISIHWHVFQWETCRHPSNTRIFSHQHGHLKLDIMKLSLVVSESAEKNDIINAALSLTVCISTVLGLPFFFFWLPLPAGMDLFSLTQVQNMVASWLSAAVLCLRATFWPRHRHLSPLVLWCRFAVSQALNHQNVISSSLNPSGYLCQLLRNSLKALLIYYIHEHGINRQTTRKHNVSRHGYRWRRGVTTIHKISVYLPLATIEQFAHCGMFVSVPCSSVVIP